MKTTFALVIMSLLVYVVCHVRRQYCVIGAVNRYDR